MTDVSGVYKSSTGFTCSFFRNLTIGRGRCSKIICRLFLPCNICIVLLFDELRSLVTVKSLQNVIHDKLF